MNFWSVVWNAWNVVQNDIISRYVLTVIVGFLIVCKNNFSFINTIEYYKKHNSFILHVHQGIKD